MATVTKFPQSNAAITTGWTNPTNVYADDTSYATCGPGKNASVVSDFYNFNFQIPAGSTINSITIEMLVMASTTASVATCDVQPILNTTLRGTAVTTPTTEPTSLTVYNGTTAGTWTVAELNDNTQAGGFKLRLSGNRGNSNTAVTWTADYVKVTVDYTEPAPTTHEAAGAGSTSITGSGAATQSHQSAGAGSASIAGSAAATLTMMASGSGSTAITGAADCTIHTPAILQAAGTGATAITGTGTAITLIRGPPSSGSTSVEGSATASIVKQAAGSGSTSVTGTAVATIALPASGSGLTTITGTADASIDLGGSGSGQTVIDGTGTATVTQQAAGAGQTVIQGQATATTIIEAAGAGSTVIDGSATGTITIQVAGSGSTTIVGSGSAIIEGQPVQVFEASGSGSTVVSGSASAVVVKEASGHGTTEIVGTASSTLVLEASGQGQTNIVGRHKYKPNIPTVRLTADYTLVTRLLADLTDEIELQADNQLSVLLAAEFSFDVHLQADAVLTIHLQGAIDMAKKNQNFELFQGDTKNVVFAVDADNPITGSSITWALFDRSGVLVLSKTTTAGITITGDKEFTVALDPDDTRTLLGTYFHEAKIVGAGLEEKTAAKGSLSIEKARLPLPT